MVVASQPPFLRRLMVPGTPKTKFPLFALNVTTHGFTGALKSVKDLVPSGSVESQSPLRRML